jgi:hypothetical protein
MAPQVAIRVLWSTVLAFAACAPTSDPTARPSLTTDHRKAPAPMKQLLAPLAPVLEAELTAVQTAPLEAIGWGEKAYRPYEPNTGESLIGSSDPAVTARLLAEAQSKRDRTYRLAVVHLLGMRADPSVDAALLALLEDRDLAAMAAYLLGRAGFKGYPARSRDDAKIIAALRAHLDDTSEFVDPFYQRTFHTQDFVLGALVRMLGPERFRTRDPRVEDQIGYALPWWSDELRAEFLKQVRAM